MDDAKSMSLEPVAWLENDLRAARSRYYLIERFSFSLLSTALVLLAFFIYAIADVLVRFPLYIRPVITLCLLGGTAFLVRRFVAVAVKKLPDEESVARLVETVREREGKSQRSRMICSLQFGRRPEIRGSMELKNETIKLARTECARPTEVAIYDRKRLKHAFRAALLAIVIYAVWWGLFNAWALTFFQRTIGLNAQYPTATQIVEVKWREVAPMRIDYPVSVQAAGRLPSAGRIVIRFDGEKEFTLPLAQDENDKLQYRAIVPAPLKPFEFRVKLGDSVTDKYSVNVKVPPAMENCSVAIKPPQYTREPSATLELGDLNVPEGSTLQFMVKPGDTVKSCALCVKDQEPVAMEKEKDLFVGGSEARISAPFSIKLVDEAGLENSDRPSYYLNVVPDQPPKVEVREPRSGSFKSNLSRLAFEVEATDDYKVESIKLIYKVYRTEVSGEHVNEKVIKHGEMKLIPGGSGVNMSGKLTKVTEEFGGAEGDRIGITAVATDNHPGTVLQGQSDEISISIVSPDELRGLIVKEQQRVFDLVAKLRDEEKRQADVIRKRLGAK